MGKKETGHLESSSELFGSSSPGLPGSDGKRVSGSGRGVVPRVRDWSRSAIGRPLSRDLPNLAVLGVSQQASPARQTMRPWTYARGDAPFSTGEPAPPRGPLGAPPTTRFLDGHASNDGDDGQALARAPSDPEDQPGGLVSGPSPDYVSRPTASGLQTPTAWKALLWEACQRTVAGLTLLATSPLLGLLALLIRISSRGPVIFRQRRVGRSGQPFEMLKFRTMHGTPEEAGESDIAWALEAAGLDVPWDLPPSDRLTQVGRFLRRTRLDELPQLLNVLRGDMLLVGPRPEREGYVELFSRSIEGYRDRVRVKPGITGLAQVHGLLGETSLTDRVYYDNLYTEIRSPSLDFRILCSTVRMAFEGVSARPSIEPPSWSGGGPSPLSACALPQGVQLCRGTGRGGGARHGSPPDKKNIKGRRGSFAARRSAIGLVVVSLLAGKLALAVRR